MSQPVDIVPVLNYYDAIAGRYNDFMTDSDAQMRQVVSREFKARVKAGNVMDFGGGTGLDLPWLLQGPYHVFFLEQSANMREVAEQSACVLTAHNRPHFIKENVQLASWAPGQLPCTEKMDGILANFAVFNCIKDLHQLFEKLALVSAGNGYIIAAVLDSRMQTVFRKYPIKTRLSALFSKTAVLYNNYDGMGHATYLHTQKQYRAASEKYFNFISYSPINGSDFALLILRRK